MLRTKAILSIGHSIFHEYRRRYPDNTHRETSPMIDESYFGLKCDATFHKGREVFQILSIIQDYEIDDITKDSTVVRAIAKVAEYWHELQETPPVWKIIGVPPGKENKLKSRLEKNSRLKVIPSSRRSAEELDKELRSSHLVLVLPSTTNYVNLTMAAMCAAIPVIYPQESQSYEFASDHIHSLGEQTNSVDMESDPELLTRKIIRVMQKNKTAVKHAKVIRQKIKNVVVRALQNINKNCLSDECDTDIDRDSRTDEYPSPEDSNKGDETKKTKCASVGTTDNKLKASDDETEGRIQEEQAGSNMQEDGRVQRSIGSCDKFSSVTRKRKRKRTPGEIESKATDERTTSTSEFKKPSDVSPRQCKKSTKKRKRRELQATGIFTLVTWCFRHKYLLNA
ncbi:uncharacterized protein [Ptychodera flava]|uniref:uncharacterized protein n=1 Tax=Ptychodera flava TaxID=63121 RepID=UPI00396A573D